MDDAQSAELLKRTAIDAELLGGKPTIRNYRFADNDILDLLAYGMTVEEIIRAYSFFEPADITAALLFASLNLSKSRIIHAA